MSKNSFNEVKNPALRTWNRCAMVFNIRADAGDAEARSYIEKFDQLERKQMKAMFDYIAVKGYNTVRAEITNGKMDAKLEA